MVRKSLLAAGIAAAILGGGAVAALDSPSSLLSFFSRSHRDDTLMVSGNIEAHESVLSFKAVQSRIVELPFDEGQWVNKGTVIARLDDSDYRQNVATAEAALDQNEQQLAASRANLEASRKVLINDEADLKQKTIDFKRYRDLWEAGATSTRNRDLAETAYSQSRAAYLRDKALEVAAERAMTAAEAAVRSARENLKLQKIILGYTVLTAPFSGVILTRQAELGEVMLPGAPVVTLADLDHVWLRAYINEPDLGRARFGLPAVISTDAFPGRTFQGRISSIASRAEFTPKSVETHTERVTLVYRIKIDIYNPTHELVPGMPADAEIQLTGIPSSTHQWTLRSQSNP
jgi:HlyD family secretion protein